MRKVRVLFKKYGRAVYISHLDIMRTFQRAFQRAGIGVKHTEGFNPHPYISIALPLSLGYTGECELLDIILECDDDLKILVEKLNRALPEGIEASDAYEGGRPVRDIAYSEFVIRLEYDGEPPQNATERIGELFKKDVITVMKRSKRGEKETDIAPMINSFEIANGGGGLIIRTRLASGATMLNPEYLIKAIEKYEPDFVPSFFEASHMNILDAGIQPFR